MSRVLVTGATGFIGAALCEHLAAAGHTVRAAMRTRRVPPAGAAESIVTGDLGAATDWAEALQGVDQVVHAAARAHVFGDTPVNAESYLETNARATQCLALAAARAGVRRFVYVSSIKVNGEQTHGRAFRADDAPQPRDVYGRSKLQGETELRRVSATNAMQFAIVRPPLVYGPAVRANFLRLMRWIDRERWLPLGAIRNQRSLVSIWNLVDLIEVLVTHPLASGRVWLVSDGEDLSTPELVFRLARAMHRRPRLVPIPTGLLQLGATILGRKAEAARLSTSLVVDASPAFELLGWSAPLRVDEGLSRTAAWYHASRPTG
jgi:nucleoside-diphosphate-sugar epimerase